MKKVLTLCIVHNRHHVLLGMKKRGFGEGKWNGFGGKVNPGESIEGATRRELFEEAGVISNNITKIGTLDFSWQDKPEILEVHIFKTDGFGGEAVESEEMKPSWFHINDIPYDDMWPDDKFWLPMLIFDQKFKGRFVFDDYNNIVEYQLDS